MSIWMMDKGSHIKNCEPPYHPMITLSSHHSALQLNLCYSRKAWLPQLLQSFWDWKKEKERKKQGAWIHLPYRVAGVISHLANMSTYRHHLPYNFGWLADSSFYGLTCYQRPKMTVRESISGVSELTNGVGGLTSWRSDWIGRFSAIHKNKLPQNKTSQVNFLWNFATLLHL